MSVFWFFDPAVCAELVHIRILTETCRKTSHRLLKLYFSKGLTKCLAHTFIFKVGSKLRLNIVVLNQSLSVKSRLFFHFYNHTQVRQPPSHLHIIFYANTVVLLLLKIQLKIAHSCSYYNHSDVVVVLYNFNTENCFKHDCHYIPMRANVASQY